MPKHIDIKRNVNIFFSVITGETFKSAGQIYGISPARCRQITCKLRRILRHPSRWRGTDEIFHKDSTAGMRANKEFWLEAARRYLKEKV